MITKREARPHSHKNGTGCKVLVLIQDLNEYNEREYSLISTPNLDITILKGTFSRGLLERQTEKRPEAGLVYMQKMRRRQQKEEKYLRPEKSKGIGAPPMT
ncbi:MAG: hypothetical protein GC154_09325 [bacterium]|nr:hypothetical protein [bacterium]